MSFLQTRNGMNGPNTTATSETHEDIPQPKWAEDAENDTKQRLLASWEIMRDLYGACSSTTMATRVHKQDSLRVIFLKKRAISRVLAEVTRRHQIMQRFTSVECLRLSDQPRAAVERTEAACIESFYGFLLPTREKEEQLHDAMHRLVVQ
jgi:hypothetical protein